MTFHVILNYLLSDIEPKVWPIFETNDIDYKTD